MKAILRHWGVVALGFCVGSMYGLFVASGPETVHSLIRWARPPAIQFEPFDVREMSLNGDRIQVRGVIGPDRDWRWCWADQDVSVGMPTSFAVLKGEQRRWAAAMFNGSACRVFGYLDHQTGRFVFDRLDQSITDWPSPQ